MTQDSRLKTPDSPPWHATCFIQSGQLGHTIKTPPPPLHRARFATVLLHLPSVPSVVLPITSPAEKAGLKQGDILVTFDGKEIKDARQLQLAVAEAPIGKAVVAEIFRDGKPLKVKLQLASGDSAEAKKPRPTKAAASWLGLDVDELPRSKAQTGISGVIVSAVEPESAAAASGIQRGDIITSVNQRRTASLKEYEAAMKAAGKRGSVALLVRRGNDSIYFALKLR